MRLSQRGGLVTWLTITVVMFGGALRYAGIMWGLPLQLHADEWVIVEYAIDLAKRNSFEPAFFARPDHLEIQLSYIAYTLWSHVVHGARPEDLFAVSQAPFYAISRAVTATFGTAMIVVAYTIGRSIAPAAGLAMALAVAVFPPFVEHSRYATPDVPLTFTVMVVILGSMRYIAADSRNAAWWWLALATAGVAAGITVKYPAAVGMSAIGVAILVRAARTGRWWPLLSRGVAALALTVGFTFVISPVLFTNAAEVRHQLTGQNSDGHLGASGLGFGGNLAFYAQQMLTSGGIILLALAAVGIWWITTRRQWTALPIGVGFVFWGALSVLSLHWDRWGLPMYLTVVLLGGLGAWASLVAKRRRSRRLGHALVIAGVSLSGAAQLSGSVAQVAYALAPDTRAVSADALDRRGVTPENAAYDGYTPFLTDGPRTVASDLMVEGGHLVDRPPRSGIRFALTSSTMAGRYLADDTRDEGAVYRLLSEIDPVASWRPVGIPPADVLEVVRITDSIAYAGRIMAGGLVGPTLTLYDLPAT